VSWLPSLDIVYEDAGTGEKRMPPGPSKGFYLGFDGGTFNGIEPYESETGVRYDPRGSAGPAHPRIDIEPGHATFTVESELGVGVTDTNPGQDRLVEEFLTAYLELERVETDGETEMVETDIAAVAVG
jgi:hypothetical protein